MLVNDLRYFVLLPRPDPQNVFATMSENTEIYLTLTTFPLLGNSFKFGTYHILLLLLSRFSLTSVVAIGDCHLKTKYVDTVFDLECTNRS